MKITVSPSVRVEITAHGGACHVAEGRTEAEARIKLARLLHALADQARKDAHYYAQLANSLDA